MPQGGTDGARFWKSVFAAWHKLPPPKPMPDTVKHTEQILAQPLWRNPRVTGGEGLPRNVVAAFAARGITHVRDLVAFFTVDIAPNRRQHDATIIAADGIVWRAIREDEAARLHNDPGCGLKAAKLDGTLSINPLAHRFY